MRMGFEVNHAKLMELGMQWVSRLAFDGGHEFLLELSTVADKLKFDEYERTIFWTAGHGLYGDHRTSGALSSGAEGYRGCAPLG